MKTFVLVLMLFWFGLCLFDIDISLDKIAAAIKAPCTGQATAQRKVEEAR